MDGLRLPGIELVCPEGDLARVARPNNLGQSLQPPDVGDEGKPCLRQGEQRPLGTEPDVAAQGQLQPGPQAVPLHDRDRRLDELFQASVNRLNPPDLPVEHHLVCRTRRIGNDGKKLVVRAQVEAGTKGLPLPSEQNDPSLCVLFRQGDRLVQGIPHPGVQCIPFVRPVQGDRPDMTLSVVGYLATLSRIRLTHENPLLLLSSVWGRDHLQIRRKGGPGKQGPRSTSRRDYRRDYLQNFWKPAIEKSSRFSRAFMVQGLSGLRICVIVACLYRSSITFWPGTAITAIFLSAL